MSFYLDTSALVALFAKEPTASNIFAVIKEVETFLPSMSDWNIAEFAAAISFKFNSGAVSAEERFEILTKFHTSSAKMFGNISVKSEDFNRAANFANQSALRLRGGDALHLSIAAGNRLPILTLDKRMIAAANTLGIEVVELP